MPREISIHEATYKISSRDNDRSPVSIKKSRIVKKQEQKRSQPTTSSTLKTHTTQFTVGIAHPGGCLGYTDFVLVFVVVTTIVFRLTILIACRVSVGVTVTVSIATA